MSEIIRRKLDEAKKEIARMESMNNTQKVEKTTRSVMPPIPEPTDIKPSSDRVAAMIEPGPKMRKKWKQV